MLNLNFSEKVLGLVSAPYSVHYFSSKVFLFYSINWPNLDALLRIVFLTFVFGYLWFYLGFIERCTYVVYLCINKYFNMRKVWIPHCPFLIDKIFSVTSPSLFFFRIRILIDSHIYMNCSYISEKHSKFFHGLIFGNLKITKIRKIIFATIISVKVHT